MTVRDFANAKSAGAETKISVGMRSSPPATPMKGARHTDAQAEGDPGDNLPTRFGRHERGETCRQEPLAHQQQTIAMSRTANCAFEPVIGDTRRQAAREPCCVTPPVRNAITALTFFAASALGRAGLSHPIEEIRMVSSGRFLLWPLIA